MKLLLCPFLLFVILGSHIVHAQIGINGSAHPSAALDVKSPGNDKAFYPPRLTTAQRLAIPNPQAGAFVYDLDKGTMYLNDGQNWLPLATTDPGLIPPVSRTASDGGAFDSFGTSVAISGDYAIVGSPNKYNYVGVAYIFVRSGNGWTEQQKIIANDTTSQDLFGKSVAMSGNYVVVGATGKKVNGNASQGTAYVFFRSGNNWTQQQRITSSDGAASDRFGQSVSISGDYIVVGTSAKSIGNHSGQGAAYVFLRTGSVWTQQQQIIPIDGESNDNFGLSCAIDGDYTVIGAPNKVIGYNGYQGAAYVFTRSGTTWTQQQRLTATDGAVSDGFGYSVALSGSSAIVGAPYKTVNAHMYQGAVYVFSRTGTTWSQQQIVLSDDGTDYDNFGLAVAISGDYIVVGAPGKTVSSNGSLYRGAAYIYKKSGAVYAMQRRLTDTSSFFSSNGYAVGLLNGTYVIGAPFPKGKVSFGTVD